MSKCKPAQDQHKIFGLSILTATEGVVTATPIVSSGTSSSTSTATNKTA